MVSSKPSFVRVGSLSFVLRARPALSTNTSTLDTVFAKLRTDERSARSQTAAVPPVAVAAASALAWLRHAQTTSWPALARIFAPSRPTPEFAPVTMMRRLATLAAVSNNSAWGTTVPSGLAASACSGRRPAAPSASAARRPSAADATDSALAGTSTGSGGSVRWPLGASACTTATESTAATLCIFAGLSLRSRLHWLAVAKCVYRTQLQIYFCS
mmetsp:Transcript_7484/g.19647  ORF Transcript_7484/g.19647 Transcript_7484/m.19647 type:complete len:214 (-) Transcript_7484:53-694(-)